VRPHLGGAWSVLGLGCLVLGMAAVASWPVTTRVGVDYQWVTKSVPLGEKLLNFLSRDLQTRRLVREIVSGASSDEDRLVRMFSWITDHVRPIPGGFPVIDDHPLHIILRGYGTPEQMAEALILLAEYAGFRGQVGRLECQAHEPRYLYAATVTLGEQTYLGDPGNHILFRDEPGRLAGVDQLMRRSDLGDLAEIGLLSGGLPYDCFVRSLGSAKAFSRSQDQQPWPRVLQEIARSLGARGDRPR